MQKIVKVRCDLIGFFLNSRDSDVVKNLVRENK